MSKTIRLVGLAGSAEDIQGNRVGSARVGKDEIGRYLENVKQTHLTESFAKPIYDVAHSAFGIPRKILDNPTHYEKEEKIYEPWGMTLRQILQTVGTHLFRDNLDQDFWIKSLKARMENSYNPSGCWVVTDVRKDNEADFIRQAGGTIIHIHRKFEECAKVNDHDTELPVPEHDSDLHLYNYDGIVELHEAVERLIFN